MAKADCATWILRVTVGLVRLGHPNLRVFGLLRLAERRNEPCTPEKKEETHPGQLTRGQGLLARQG